MNDIDNESPEALSYAAYEAYKSFLDLGISHQEALQLLSISEDDLANFIVEFEPLDEDDD